MEFNISETKNNYNTYINKILANQYVLMFFFLAILLQRGIAHTLYFESVRTNSCDYLILFVIFLVLVNFFSPILLPNQAVFIVSWLPLFIILFILYCSLHIRMYNYLFAEDIIV